MRANLDGGFWLQNEFGIHKSMVVYSMLAGKYTGIFWVLRLLPKINENVSGAVFVSVAVPCIKTDGMSETEESLLVH